MKRFKNIAILIVLISLVPGLACKKFLDEKPISTISPDKFWKDRNDAATWMAGVYNSLQTTLSTNYYEWGEVRADHIRVGGTGNAQLTMITNTLSANDADINETTRWSALYTTISLCNYGIKYLPAMIDANIEGAATTYRDYLGQCYAIRSLMYFYGLRVWGRMPLHLEPIESINQTLDLPRSSIEQVKTQILSDITESLKIIGSSATQRYYMQKAAVYALQTDVAMWFQDYDLALSASQNCITASGCTWVTNLTGFKNIFIAPDISTETIFNLFWSVTERGGGLGVCSRVGSSSNTNRYEPTTEIWLEMKNRVDPVTGKSSDGRLWAYWDTLTYTSEAIYDASTAIVQLGKFSPWRPVQTPNNFFIFEGNTDCSVKIPVYRFADIMLLRAEALNKTGQHQQALAIVNTVRNRVGYMVNALLTDYTGDITKGIERTILKERQYELMGEGKRWFDLCRIGTIYNYTNAGYEYLRETLNPILSTRPGSILYENENMGRVLFPINAAMFNANPKLRGDQNPPYDE